MNERLLLIILGTAVVTHILKPRTRRRVYLRFSYELTFEINCQCFATLQTEWKSKQEVLQSPECMRAFVSTLFGKLVLII